MTEIFLSYAKQDREIAKKLAYELEAEGYEVWWDVNLEPGEAYQDEIAQRIREAKAVTVLWTTNSVNSVWVLSEANRAYSQKKLIPIVADNLTALDLPVPYNVFHFIPLDDRELLRRKLKSLGVKIAGNPWKPLIVTKFERMKVYDVAGGLALDCDHAEGRFTRDKGWEFEVYFDDEHNDHTFPGTRFSEFYIRAHGVTQWMWGAGDDRDKISDWHFGWLMLQDLIHGLADRTPKSQ